MSSISHIRKHVFGKRQADFAVMIGVAQSTVSRWERGDSAPTLDELRAIRAEALRSGIPWQDIWFFEIPEAAE